MTKKAKGVEHAGTGTAMVAVVGEVTGDGSGEKLPAIVESESSAVIAVGDDSLDFDEIAADSGMGLEGADNKSFAIPFLVMLQSMSPMVQDEVEGAKAGLILNTVTGELHSDIEIIPVAFQRQYLRWAPRSGDGGLRGVYAANAVEIGEVGGITHYNGRMYMDVPEGQIPVDPDGKPKYDTLNDTRVHYVMYRDKNCDNWSRAIISLSSTQVKNSKRLMALIGGVEFHNKQGHAFNPPSFANIYSVERVKEKNTKGTWWGWNFSIDRKVESAKLYNKAKDFNKQVFIGEIEAQHQQSVGGDAVAVDDIAF